MAAHLSQTAPANVNIETRLTDIAVPTGVSVSIALFVNEMVTNALRHAFVDGRSGTVVIESDVEGDDIRVIVRDDGGNLPESFSMDNSTGLGMQVAKAMAAQLGGSVTANRTANGAAFELNF